MRDFGFVQPEAQPREEPLWLMRRDAEQMLADLARQLGLTPTARLRAGVMHARPPDPNEVAPSVTAIAKYMRALEEQ